MDRKVIMLNSNLPSSSVLTPSFYTEIGANIGNAYIAYSCARLFGLDARETTFYNNIGVPEENPGVLRERAVEASSVVLVLQDQIRADFPDSWYVHASKLIQDLGGVASFLTLSLSANSFAQDWDPDLASKLSPAKVKFFKIVAERSRSIGVRGVFAADVLAKLGITNVEVVGCPSYFETGPVRIVPPVDRISRADRSLGMTGALRLNRHEGRTEYFLQGDADWPIVELMHCILLQNALPTVGELGETTAALLVPSIENRVHFFTNFSLWKSYITDRCFAVVGTRLHGAIVALNAGVPAAVTNIDCRARETCELFGIPRVPKGFHPDSDPSEIAECCGVECVNARYPGLYLAFSAWARANNMPLADDLSCSFDPPQIKKVSNEILEERVTYILGGGKS